MKVHVVGPVAFAALQARAEELALEAAREIHFPKSEAEIDELLGFKTRWHARFIYEEFFKFEYFVLMQKLGVAKERAPSIGLEGGAKSARDLEGLLPFRLTGGQSQALADMRDLARQGVGMGRDHTLFALSLAVRTRKTEWEINVLCDGFRAQQIKMLKHHADLLAQLT